MYDNWRGQPKIPRSNRKFELHGKKINALVREFFQDDTDFGEEFSESQVHTQAASACLSYINLSYDHFPPTDDLYTHDGTEVLKSFEAYLLAEWPLHCQKALEEGRKLIPLKRLFEMLTMRESVSSAFVAWSKWVWLSFMASHTYERDMDLLIRRAFAWEFMTLSDSSDPFFVACRWQFPEVVKAAISRRPNVVQAKTLPCTSRFTGLAVCADFTPTQQILEAELAKISNQWWLIDEYDTTTISDTQHYFYFLDQREIAVVYGLWSWDIEMPESFNRTRFQERSK